MCRNQLLSQYHVYELAVGCNAAPMLVDTVDIEILNAINDNFNNSAESITIANIQTEFPTDKSELPSP